MRQAASPAVCWMILLTGIVATACSFVFIRQSTDPPVTLAAWRVLLAAALLCPVYLRARRRYADAGYREVFSRSLLPGVVLAAHFVTWVIGARLSLGANATIIVNLVPLVMPVLLWLLFGEHLHRGEALATLLAVAGLGILAIDNLTLSTGYLAGDATCLVSMFLFALYLALARRHSSLPSLWLYVVPVYAVAGAALLMVAPLFGQVIPAMDAMNLTMVLALAAVSTVIGHSALNFAMQHMRGQTVGVMTLAQFIVAGLIAYWLYDEIPSVLFYPATALMLSGMVLVMFNQQADDVRTGAAGLSLKGRLADREPR
ncbi:MAG: DMT family transporter [Granulosicoccus sp.]|nr:DMT family transporter [Granulosicoccus sp.]